MWSRREREMGERDISRWIRIMWEMEKKRIKKGEMMWME